MKLTKLITVLTVIGSMSLGGSLQAFAASSSEIMEQIESYMSDLEASQQQSEELEDEIASKQDEVGALFSEITALNIEKEDYYQGMKQRIAYFYEESQGSSLIASLFASDSFADFINRIQFQQSLYDYDAARLEEYQALVSDIEEKQAALDAEIESLGDMVEEQVVLQAALDAAIAVKQTEYDEAVAAEEAEAAALAAAEAAAREAAEQEAARRAEEEAMAYALSYDTSYSEETYSSSDTSYVEAASSSSAESSSSSSSAESSSSSSSAESSSSSSSSSSAESSSSSSSSSGTYNYPTGSGILTYTGGVNYFNGHMETWYTRRQWTGDLGIPGMYIGSDGIIRDGDGYICVASDDDPKGTIVETSLGTGKVYDSGPGHGIIDIYTDWPLY